jgi:tetratricopeptide (TPR) repeat protein
MKKLFLVMAFALAVVATGFAQKANVSKAKNKALAVEAPDFQGAKDAIEEALVNDETKGLANTWYVAGLVYEKSADAEFILTQTGSGDAIKMGEDALKAYTYYLKANELDQLPDEKGKVKPKFTKKIAASMLNIYNKYILVNYGVEKYSAQEWVAALNAFEKKNLVVITGVDLERVADQLVMKMEYQTYYL